MLFAGGDNDPFAIVGRPVTPAGPKGPSRPEAAESQWKSPDSVKASTPDEEEEVFASHGDGFGPGSVYDPNCPGTFDMDSDEFVDPVGSSAADKAPGRSVHFEAAVCGKGIRA